MTNPVYDLIRRQIIAQETTIIRNHQSGMRIETLKMVIIRTSNILEDMILEAATQNYLTQNEIDKLEEKLFLTIDSLLG